MTEFLLIRHGANDYTRTHRLAGWTPGVHLNAHGQAQAAAIGQRLAATRIDALYASPLDRTVETAQAILAHHPALSLNLLEAIGEVKCGDWQGQELGKLARRKVWRTVQMAPSRFQFPGGETFRSAQQRAVDALELLRERHARQTVAVVSHSDIIKLVVAHYIGLPLDLFQRIEISTASLTVLACNAQFTVIKQINETAYLPAEKPDQPSSQADGQTEPKAEPETEPQP